MDKDATLEYTKGRIVAKIIARQKNGHTFADGTEIVIIREADNLDNAYVKQTFGEVVSGDGIPAGALMLFHFNSVHDSNRIFNYGEISGEDIASGIDYYSFPVEECFLWKMPNEKEWHPIGGFVLAYRVFVPYEGIIQGVEPKQLKDTLYIRTGDLAGNVCHTLPACDFRLIFRNLEGRDEVFIRCRHFPDDENADREEITCINHDLTEKVKSGKLLVGIMPQDAKKISD